LNQFVEPVKEVQSEAWIKPTLYFDEINDVLAPTLPRLFGNDRLAG
jgi:hypothetical protein